MRWWNGRGQDAEQDDGAGGAAAQQAAAFSPPSICSEGLVTRRGEQGGAEGASAVQQLHS